MIVHRFRNKFYFDIFVNRTIGIIFIVGSKDMKNSQNTTKIYLFFISYLTC